APDPHPRILAAPAYADAGRGGGTRIDGAADLRGGPAGRAGQPVRRPRAAGGNEEPPEPRDAGAPEPDDRDADSLPTCAVFTVGTSAAAASAERAGEPVDDGTAETPPSGQRGDRQGVRGGWGLPARATGAATPEADADGVPDGSDRAAAGTATAGS